MTLPQRTPTAPDAESGRGLLLVEALADRWGAAAGPYPRKTVWAEVKVRPEEPVRRQPGMYEAWDTFV